MDKIINAPVINKLIGETINLNSVNMNLLKVFLSLDRETLFLLG